MTLSPETTTFYYFDNATLSEGWDGDIVAFADALKDEFIAWREGRVILPEKSSQIIEPFSQGRVNCMPATLLDAKVSGVKLVSVFPDNTSRGLPNVSGLITILSARDGMPLAVLDAGFVTALRTALVGGVAARCLAVESPRSIALLGSGEQARAHFLVFASLFPSLGECRVASRSEDGVRGFLESVGRIVEDMQYRNCGSDYRAAAEGADIIITAISGQEPLLRADWVHPGCFYCHVGGWEDEYAVALKSSKIVCDSWEALKHRGSPTIARMFNDGVLRDEDIYADLADILSGVKAGRETPEEIVYFNSIGLAFTDIAVALELYRQCSAKGLGVPLLSRFVSPSGTASLKKHLALRRTGGLCHDS